MLVETLDAIPESLRDQFEQVELEGGKKAYQDKDSLELKRHLQNVKADNAKYIASLKDTSERLSQIEAGKAAEIEAARQKALDEARSKGDVKAIEERYQQQMADLEKRVAERTRDEVTKELTQKQAQIKASGIAETIAAGVAVDAKAANALKKLLSDRVKVEPETGKEYFLDDNGGALSVNRADFEKLIADEYPNLVKFTPATTGAGGANGNNGGGAPNSASKNDKAEEAKKKGDVSGFLKASLNIRGT